MAQQAAELADPLDPLSLIQLTRTTDVNGRIYTRTYEAEARTTTSTTPEGRVGTVVLDERGRPVRFTSGDLAPVRIEYDARNRIHQVQHGERTATFTYDAETGYLTATVDPLKRRTRYERDALGRLTTLTRPDESAWQFRRSEAGNLEQLIEPDDLTTHRFTWTPLDQLASYRSPAGATNRFFYDLDRRLRKRELPSGDLIQWTYDRAGRPTTITLPAGQHSYAHDETAGQLTNVVSLDGQKIHYEYDGALLTNTTWSGGAAGEVSYQYDSDLRLSQLSYGGQTVDLGYDTDRLLIALGAIQLERDPANGLTAALTDGDLRVDYGRNGYGRVDSVSAKHGDQTLCTWTATYDDLGRLTRKEETIGGEFHVWEYEYDVQSRLTVVQRDEVVEERYAYDVVANRLGLSHTARGLNRTAGDYEYNADHQLLRAGGEAYEYDPDGRLARQVVGGQITQYDYRTDGALSEVDLPDDRVITYQYDAAQRRVAKAVDGVTQRRWVYGSGLTPLAEYDGEDRLLTRYLYPGSALPTAFVRGEQRY